MKPGLLCLAAIAFVAGTGIANAAVDTAQIQTAKDLWNKRAYTTAGLDGALASAKIYESQIGNATNPSEQAELAVGAAQGFYFYAHEIKTANASKDTDDKVAMYDHAVQVIDAALKGFDIDDVTSMDAAAYQKLAAGLADAQKEVIGHLLYERGANFAQYISGRSDQGVGGMLAALRRFHEIKDTCDGIKYLGLNALDFHGYERIVGYALYRYGVRQKTPDKAEGLRLLQVGYAATLDAKTNTNVYGYNTTFLAEALKGSGNEKQAKDILNTLIKTNPAAMAPGWEIENARAIDDAKKLLTSWD